MKQEKKQTISEIIEEVKCEICDNYCKYPKIAYELYKDIDEAETELEMTCKSCPLERMLNDSERYAYEDGVRFIITKVLDALAKKGAENEEGTDA